MVQVSTLAPFHPLDVQPKVAMFTQRAMADLMATLKTTFACYPHYKSLLSSAHSSQLRWD